MDALKDTLVVEIINRVENAWREEAEIERAMRAAIGNHEFASAETSGKTSFPNERSIRITWH